MFRLTAVRTNGLTSRQYTLERFYKQGVDKSGRLGRNREMNGSNRDRNSFEQIEKLVLQTLAELHGEYRFVAS